MPDPKSTHPLLDSHIAAEYRHQDNVSERIYTRASWLTGLCALMGGAAYTVRRPDLLPLWHNDVIVFLYAASGLALLGLLISVLWFITLGVFPRDYEAPPRLTGWLRYSTEKRQQTPAPGTSGAVDDTDAKFQADLADITDKQRDLNRRRFRRIHTAHRLVLAAAFVTVLHLLAAGIARLALGP